MSALNAEVSKGHWLTLCTMLKSECSWAGSERIRFFQLFEQTANILFKETVL
jgi:hypothetical protein